MAEYSTDVSGPGDTKPYGTPIRDSIASGDATQMQLQYDSAQRWLAANPGDPAAEDVKIALAELESALRTL
jgi:hypothetical protein